jgi:Uma2 family endonuclease
MTTATATRQFTMNDLLAMPDDRKKRWIIDGELHEEDTTRRNRFHSSSMARLTGELYIWWSSQPAPRGELVCGEAAVQLTDDDDATGFGVDIAYVSADVMVRQTDEHTIIVGVPKLIVEILSPSTLIEDLHEKIDIYLEAGVPIVWVVDPRNRNVTIYKPNDDDSLVNVHQQLTGGDVLPGFSVPVARLFE